MINDQIPINKLQSWIVYSSPTPPQRGGGIWAKQKPHRFTGGIFIDEDLPCLGAITLPATIINNTEVLSRWWSGRESNPQVFIGKVMIAPRARPTSLRLTRGFQG